MRDFSKEYEEAIGPGSVLPVTDTELGKIACLVERDLMPEAMRIVAAKGAEIVIQPTFEGAGSGGKVHNRWLPYAAIKQCLAYYERNPRLIGDLLAGGATGGFGKLGVVRRPIEDRWTRRNDRGAGRRSLRRVGGRHD